ncbi:MAG: four helix bundle protein [Verrucomicrobia bacterium]|nr:four helix bundle protein [Verrucomicrobiota bacterium]
MSDERKKGMLEERTRAFALAIIRVFAALPRTEVARILGRQMVRSGTSVGAQYREGSRARSSAEFISKLESALQELEETQYWLELLTDSGVSEADALAEVRREAGELTAMLRASVLTIKRRGRS